MAGKGRKLINSICPWTMAMSALYTVLELMMGREKLHNICMEQTRVSVIITLTQLGSGSSGDSWGGMAMVTTESPDSGRYQCFVLCNLMQYETSTHCLNSRKNMSSLADPNFFPSLQCIIFIRLGFTILV